MTKNINLQGDWQFELDLDRKGVRQSFYNKNLEDTITLPGTTSMAHKGTPSAKRETGSLTDPYLFEGYAWYSREITLDAEDIGKPVFLYLERTRITKVWVDNTLIGSHDSLNTPHIYDLTDAIKDSRFRLTILVANIQKEENGVSDPLAYPTKGGHLTSPDTQTNWNGILGEIALHIYEPLFIPQVKAFPNISDKSVTLKLTCVNTTSADASRIVRIQARPMDINGPAGQQTALQEFDIPFPVGQAVTEITYALGDNAVLWSEYTPVIYEITAAIADASEKTTTTFGLRDFSTNKKEFLINGRQTFLRGKHDGLIFPLTGAVPAQVDEWVQVLTTSKSYGINHYRFHTCCPPEAAFVAADLVGIYMEPQLPFWGTLTAPGDEGHNEEEQDYLIEEGFRMMNTFGNHASYCMMSLGNELWGSKERISEILQHYKAVDTRHLYTQGSNNFQHTPVILPEEDFFVGVRLSKNRLFRGSYGMCDAPLGHIQTAEPSTRKNYDEVIKPSSISTDSGNEAEEIEIQYGTGVKKVKATETDAVLIPDVPVVSHEIGQFCVYPDFREIEKYTGVLKPRNLEIFRERLAQKGMLEQAHDFFYNSGKLAVQCYKEELEAAARTEMLAGYQILDIQDFTGQGTALVGILDAFMDNKGLVRPEEWAAFCSDAILMAQFDSYVLTSGETFTASLALRYYRPEHLGAKQAHYHMALTDGTVIAEGRLSVNGNTIGLQKLGEISFPLPETAEPAVCCLTLTIDDTDIRNQYELYLYPAADNSLFAEQPATLGEGEYTVYVTSDFEQATQLLEQSARVLYLPNETPESIKGFYCTDFWCYPMFRDICEWMKKPTAIGTMGMLIQNEHPALHSFPSHTYATPQWYQLVSHCDCAILDESTDAGYRPIVQMIDNFERNHKLGILFEGRAGNGLLMVCTIRLSELMNMTEPTKDESITATGEVVTYRNMNGLPEAAQFIKSLTEYVTSDEFTPEQTLDIERLRKTFSGEA